MKTFNIQWNSYGYVDIEAETEDEAIEKFHALPDDQKGAEDEYMVQNVEELFSV